MTTLDSKTEYDDLHTEIVEWFEKDSFEINDKIKRICQQYNIDWKKKENIIPFLRLALIIKQNF